MSFPDGASDYADPTQEDSNGECGDTVYNSLRRDGGPPDAWIGDKRKKFKEYLSSMFPKYATYVTAHDAYPGRVEKFFTHEGQQKSFFIPLCNLGMDDWKDTPIQLLEHAQAQLALDPDVSSV